VDVSFVAHLVADTLSTGVLRGDRGTGGKVGSLETRDGGREFNISHADFGVGQLDQQHTHGCSVQVHVKHLPDIKYVHGALQGVVDAGRLVETQQMGGLPTGAVHTESHGLHNKSRFVESQKTV
jgi:hypothetical protein